MDIVESDDPELKPLPCEMKLLGDLRLSLCKIGASHRLCLPCTKMKGHLWTSAVTLLYLEPLESLTHPPEK